MGAIDIVVNLHTEQEVRGEQTGIDDSFKTQIRMSDDSRDGVSIDRYLKKMDRAGIERSMLIAVRAGDLNVRGSFEVPFANAAGTIVLLVRSDKRPANRLLELPGSGCKLDSLRCLLASPR